MSQLNMYVKCSILMAGPVCVGGQGRCLCPWESVSEASEHRNQDRTWPGGSLALPEVKIAFSKLRPQVFVAL